MSQKTRLTLAVAAVLIATLAVAPAIADSTRSDLPPVPAKVPVFHPPVVPEAPPANDNFVNATTIAPIPFSDALSTVEATDEAGEPASSCTSAGNGVWYTYTNSSGNLQSLSANTLASDYDTVLDVYTGAWGALTEIACNDDAVGLQSQVSFNVQAGETVYIRAGGFAGDTGNLQFDVPTVTEFTCENIVINGLLGSGSPDWPSFSGTQLGRLNRNGISSTCAAPKTCLIFTAADNRAFDAYTIPNDSADTQCVSVHLEVIDQAGCNLQSNAYLNLFDPNNICTNYLADPGLSSGTPPTPTDFSFEIPSGESMVVVVHTTNPGEINCNYVVTVQGNICLPQVPNALEIPTLGRFGLAALAVLMLGGAVVFLRRRRHA